MPYNAVSLLSEADMVAKINEDIAATNSNGSRSYADDELEDLETLLNNFDQWSPKSPIPLGRILDTPLFQPIYPPPPTAPVQESVVFEVAAKATDADIPLNIPEVFEKLLPMSIEPKQEGVILGDDETFIPDVSDAGNTSILLVDAMNTTPGTTLIPEEDIIDEGEQPDIYGTDVKRVVTFRARQAFQEWVEEQRMGIDIFPLADGDIACTYEASWKTDHQNLAPNADKISAEAVEDHIDAEEKEKEPRKRVELIIKRQQAIANDPSLKPSNNQKRAAAQKSKHNIRKPLTVPCKASSSSEPEKTESEPKTPEENNQTNGSGGGITFYSMKSGTLADIMSMLLAKTNDAEDTNKLEDAMKIVREIAGAEEQDKTEATQPIQPDGIHEEVKDNDTSTEQSEKMELPKQPVKGMSKKARNKAKKQAMKNAGI